jgi:class 3 adenylate cyclase
MAEHIPGAIYEELPGSDSTAFTEGADAVVARVGRFIGAMPEAEADDRMLATVMFTDIVKSTDRLVALGDRRWKDILDAHDSITRQQLEIHKGRFIKSTGDGILATFEAPSRAIRCAVGLCERLREVGVDVRTGLHSGEIEVRTDGDVGGVAVHVAARVMSKAEQGEVLASRTVRDLVTGGDVSFQDRGLHELKGIPEQWQLFSVEMTSAHG